MGDRGWGLRDGVNGLEFKDERDRTPPNRSALYAPGRHARIYAPGPQARYPSLNGYTRRAWPPLSCKRPTITWSMSVEITVGYFTNVATHFKYAPVAFSRGRAGT